MLRILRPNVRLRGALLLAVLVAWVAGAVPAGAKPPLVLVTNKPLYGLTAFIMRKAGTPTLLLEGNPYLRTRPLNVDEAALLKRGGLVIWIGPRFEPYLKTPLANLKDRVRSLPLMNAPGIRLIGRSGGGNTAAAAKPRAATKKAARRRVAVKKNRSGRRTIVIPRDGGAVKPPSKPSTNRSGGGKPAYTPRNRQITRADLRPKNPDPHIWLDPRNAISMARQIASTLIEVDPAGRRIYRRNLARLIVRIETLDAENRVSLQAITPGRYAIVGAKTRYYESHYLLRPASRLAISARKFDRNMIAAVRRRLAQEGSRCIYGGTIFNDKAVRQIGGRARSILVIDPYGLTRPADDQVYFAIMAHVTDRFVRCLDPAQATR